MKCYIRKISSLENMTFCRSDLEGYWPGVFGSLSRTEYCNSKGTVPEEIKAGGHKILGQTDKL